MVSAHRIALVTTCLNEAGSVTAWKRSILAQTKPPDEISIVDAGSTDGTWEELKRWQSNDSRVMLVRAPGCTVAQGRNLAIASTNSDIIASTDMGCELDCDWLRQLVQPLLDDLTIQVVAGNYRVRESELTSSCARAAFHRANGYRPKLSPGFLPSSRSIAYRKQIWEDLGGYPEDLTYAADDTVFAMQILAGRLTIAFADRAIAYWHRPKGFRHYWRESYRYAFGNGEAGILPARVSRRARAWWYPLMIPLFSLYRGARGSLKPIIRALRNGDVIAALIMPLLSYGSAVSWYRGGRAGLFSGDRRCNECRKRTRNLRSL